jgi:hypothetical protein
MPGLQLERMTRRRILLLAFGLVLAGAGAAAGVMRAGAGASSPLALVPANLAALNAADTIRPGGQTAPGGVHALGRDRAFAWNDDGKVCWSSGIASGCADPSPGAEHGIDVTVADPDRIRQGEPARIGGLAVDSIVRVTATLEDGRTFAAVPVDNWYEIKLPDTAAPWDVARVSAQVRSGHSVAVDVPLRAPAVP